MTTRRFLVFFMLCVLALLPSALFSADVDGIVASLQARYDAVTALSADFTQEVLTRSSKKPVVVTGKVFFKKPGKMRWQYSGENADELVSNGKTAWFYQSDLNQVIERKADSSISGISTDFLSGIVNLKKDFDVRLAPEKSGAAGHERVELTPKQEQQGVKRIFITIEAKTGTVVKTSVEDQLGTVTDVSFRKIRLNPAIKDSFFDYSAPKGATIISPTLPSPMKGEEKGKVFIKQ